MLAGRAVLYVRIPAEMMVRIRTEAASFQVSHNDFVTRALELYLAQNFGWESPSPSRLP